MKNLIALTVLTCLHLVFAAVPHSHSHKESGERTQDGAYSPRDHGHYNKDGHDSSFDHEAILGSAKDAEEFDQLPPEEAKRRLQVTAN